MSQNQVTPFKERAIDQVNGTICTHQADNQHRTLESAKPVPTQLSTDRRVPFEVWQHICSFLYPSQLSRMSMVNTTLHKVVDSLPYWSLLFRQVFGPTKAL